MQELLSAQQILFGIDETTQPQRKYLLKDNLFENVSSVLYYAGSDDSLLAELGIPFDTPKPVSVAKRLIESTCRNEDIVLDFFAGSGTTAHAVMAINIQDSYKLRYILVQLPEDIAHDSEAHAAGFNSIASLTCERLRRAGRKIKEEADLAGKFLDIGFRLLKVDTSNMKDVFYKPDAVRKDDLFAHVDNIKKDRTPEDLLFQVLLDWGVDLSLPIKKEDIDGKAVYFVDQNALAGCFDTGITEDMVKKLAARKPLRVVFRDSGFSSDAVKINVEQIFKLLSPDTEVKAI